MSTKSDRFDLNGNPYDISAACIQSRADMDGASVFVIEGRIGKLRVLDFSEREAELTYKNEADEVDPPACECCGWSKDECKCSQIDALRDEADDLDREASDLRKRANELIRS